MPRIRMQLEAPAADLAMWLPILAELLRGLRSWRFVDGVLLNRTDDRARGWP
jgi:hypothetical protein